MWERDRGVREGKEGGIEGSGELGKEGGIEEGKEVKEEKE